MSAEIQWRGTETVVTLYATIRSKTGTQWRTDSSAFEAVTAANWANYDIALAESSGNYFYTGDFPAITGNLVAGWYWVDIYKRAGATPAITDTLQGTIVGYWDGTGLLPWESDVRAIATNAINAAALDAGASTEINAAVLAAIAGIGSGTGAALNFAVYDDNTDGALATLLPPLGSPQGATTFANTLANDGTNHVIAAAQVGGTGNYKIDWLYAFSTGAGRSASKVVLRAMSGATNDTVTVSAYNFGTTNWDARTAIAVASETLFDVPLLAGHTGTTGTDIGKVYIRLQYDEADAGTLTIDECYVQAQQSGSLIGYADGAVWVKATGTAASIPYVNGTADNPCPWANATVIAGLLGLTRYRIVNSETVTLSASTINKSLIGKNWTLELGSQDISDSYFEGAKVSGIASAAVSTPPIFEYCGIGAVTIPGCRLYQCGLGRASGTFTATGGTASQYNIIDCFSLVPGAGTPVFTFAGGTTSRGINIRRWSGGTNITLDSVCTLSVEVVTGGGQTIEVGAAAGVEIRGICRQISLTGITAASTVQIDAITGPITLAGANGTVNVYGICSSVTDSRTGTPTLNTYADLDVTTNAIKTKTDFLPSYTAGAAGGLFIAGVNASCTITDVTTAGSVGKYLKDILDDTAILPAVWVVPGVGTSTLTTSDIDARLAAIHLDHWFATAASIPAAAAGTFYDQLLTNGSATYDRTTDSLQAIRDRGDAAWVTATGFATPTNITSASGIQLAASQHVIVDSGTVTVSDKTGFKLASDGLDTIAITAPVGAASNFREMIVQVWRRFFRKATRTDSAIITYADNGTTPVTTQVISNDGTTETQGTAT
jgi:hypothetical protein